MKEKYDFGLDFQRNILKFILVVPDWLPANLEFLQPKHMDTAELEMLVRLCVEFNERYDTPPDLEVLRERISENATGEMRRLLLAELDEVDKLDIPPSKLQYVTDRLRKFATKQRYRESIIKSAEYLEQDNVEAIRSEFDTAASFGENARTDAIFLFDKDSIEERADRTGHDAGDKIPTLLRTVDKRLRGGPSRKELATFMMPPGRGKSMALVNVGNAGLAAGANVLHVTVEMSAKRTTYRYDSRLTGMSYEEISSNPDKFKDLIGRYRTIYKGNLVVKEWPARSATVGDIRAYMKVLSRRHDFHTDMLIVDYVDELRRPKREMETYAIGDVVANLRGLAMETNVVVWTATQTTKAGFSKVTLDLDDVADSWEKVKISDIIIAGCQTPDEFEENKMRWIIAKNRDNRKYLQPIAMETDFERSLYRELTS